MNFRKTLYIDLGTANTRIADELGNIILNEPTVVALRTNPKPHVLAVGKAAKKLLGREPRGIIAKKPLKNGCVANSQLTRMLLESFLSSTKARNRGLKPNICVSTPFDLSSVEERALVRAFESYGISRLTLVPRALAAASGVSLPVEKSEASMIVDLGAGTCEAALLSSGGVVSSFSHKGCGESINESIISVAFEKFGINISEKTAEQVKVSVASVLKDEANRCISISGFDSDEGILRTVEVCTNDVYKGIREVFEPILDKIRKMLANSPSSLVSRLSDIGIALTGGTSLLYNLDIYFTKSLGIPCYTVDEPMLSVVKGL